MCIKYVIIGSIMIISLIILISRRVFKSRVLSYSPNILLSNFADIKLFNIKINSFISNYISNFAYSPPVCSIKHMSIYDF